MLANQVYEELVLELRLKISPLNAMQRLRPILDIRCAPPCKSMLLNPARQEIYGAYHLDPLASDSRWLTGGDHPARVRLGFHRMHRL
jgi:hypothetical protein